MLRNAQPESPTMTTILSEAICHHIAEFRSADLPSSTVAATLRILLDATGVIYAASGASPDVQPFVNLALAAGPGTSSVLGTGQTSTATMAAFANGAMAHALDFEDAFDAAPSHPNASMVPAALALAQAHGPVDGRTFLAAIAIGCDLVCRIGLSLTRRMEVGGWYPPPILGALGATAACARILKLDWKQTRDALSLVLCQVSAPGEIKNSPTTVIRAVREAFPAQAALQAALLARDGVTGFEAPLEGAGGFYRLYVDGHYREEILFDGLGQHFFGEQLSFKPFPTCRGTHPFIEMAQRIVRRHNIIPDEIAHITVRHDAIQQMLVEPLARKQAPMVAIDAKFSIPFTLATAIVRGRVSLDDFSPTAITHTEILALAARISAEREDHPAWTLGSGGAIRIALQDGRVFHDQVDDAPGSQSRPLSTNDLMEKFIDCVGRAQKPIIGDKARILAEAIMTSDTSGDIGALFV